MTVSDASLPNDDAVRPNWIPPAGWRGGAPRLVEKHAGEDKSASGNAPSTLQCLPLVPIGATNIPPRPWAYGKFLLFGTAAVLGAVDGGGKGAIAVVMALATITGKPLLGEKIWRTGPVAIITYEDDETEWHRRIAAACQYHALDYGEVISKIRFLSKPGGRISFVEMLAGRTLLPDGDAIVKSLREIEAVLLIVDPFNHAHALDDGNNNVLVARVAAEISRVAFEADVAALVLHHLRKGASGGVDDLMGATSLRATFRSCRILTRMSHDEAKALNVLDSWRHIRLAGTKENYAPPPDKATWFKLMSVPLGNGTEEYPEGDDIGVATTWEPPSPFEGLDYVTLRTIFDLIQRGPSPGESYSPHKQANHWVGKPIIDAAGKTPEQAARIVKQWIANDVLTVEDYVGARRHEVKRVILNEQKAAEILTPLRPHAEAAAL